MTRASKHIPPRGRMQPEHLQRALRRAGWVLFWERLRHGAWMPLSLLFLFAALAAAGLFERLPLLPHALLLAGFAVALAASLWLPRGALARLRFPAEEECARRLEEENALAHRPVRGRGEVPIVNAGNGLWQAHRNWQDAQLHASLRSGRPRPLLAAWDAYALRAAALLLAIAALGVAADPAQRLWRAVAPLAERGGADAALDIWVAPPAYTGRAPLYPETAAGTAQDMQVPENSELVMQLDGGTRAILRLRHPDEEGEDEAPAYEEQAFETLPSGRLEYRAALLRDSEVELALPGWPTPRRWRFDVLPDRPPMIEMVAPVGFTPLGSLRIEYVTGDDYGIAATAALLERDFTAEENRRLPPARPYTPLQPPAIVSLPLAPSPDANTPVREYHDLASHPWAGLPVRMRLAVRDESGQRRFSQTVAFRLPQVAFESPLARAFIELRQRITLDAGSAGWAALALDAMALGADVRETSASDWLHLRAAYWKLRLGATPQALEETRDLLWRMALRAESGELSDLEERLRAAREALQRALAEGAPEREIQELLDKFRSLLAQYLQERAQESTAQGAPAGDSGAEFIDAGQIDDMLERIGELSAVGALDEARQLLSELNEILENLQFASPPLDPQQRARSEALQQLGELERRQQQLMDQTFQEQMRGGASSEAARALQELQQSLRESLQEVLGQMGEDGLQTPASLQAGEGFMGEAASELGLGALEQGLQAQAQALEQLRQGRDELRRQGGGGQAAGRQGRDGRGGSGHDPLGRSLPDSGVATDDDIVPDDYDPKQARQLRSEILRRMGESWRPRDELNYLERLLRQGGQLLQP